MGTFTDNLLKLTEFPFSYSILHRQIVTMSSRSGSANVALGIRMTVLL